jgi:thiosulfate reductase cytochrome b subunit
LFVVVHLIEVLLTGVFNEMRSILTGWFAVRPEKTDAR